MWRHASSSTSRKTLIGSIARMRRHMSFLNARGLEAKYWCWECPEFISDLQKLTWFCCHAAYHRGIFLVYGNDPAAVDGKTLPQRKLRQALDGAVDIDLTFF